mmetsp:Transcript_12903/g.23257  ORF Transcript_12903/g.23257 Transcript_12903/m.23257 type:complete len:292 (+) Transcript_12903:158-1033(+)|eukprot:CAMPEP_0203755732 /NCGR_PEP_ID=MMETSP0098-20131031/9132_1 /ASSEMBLY_ACC=CAM_ASM_000208 /TAXON_ID=96639 /ORGANISM=" , Strain NY0313808BC1" /LENGTH=291 /DNA_ID=CAMNT_0050647315 /DNA_START=34 /DNA_END=909 /DNA_ORIENTATION=-
MTDAYTTEIPAERAGTCLLIVDPQNDFHPGGSLAIPTANEDAVRIAKMIMDNLHEISEIFVTLDTHMQYHISHGLFWVDKDGKHPPPFTQITVNDVKGGVWMPTRKEPAVIDWCVEYLENLEAQGKFTHTIWPVHCQIGTTGHAVSPIISKALDEWEREKVTTVQYVIKGNNSYTEHYSVFRAEVVRLGDPATALNSSLIERLRRHERVLVCGQAKSHCVNFTVRDLVNHWPTNRFQDICILEDASSSVPGFEKEGETFIKDMKHAGLKILNTSTCFVKPKRGSRKNCGVV